MNGNKIDGDTQIGCAPMIALFFVAVCLVVLANRSTETLSRLDAIEKALAAKETGK